MGQRVVTTLHDDLDPSVEADETVRFGLDGTDYEIDLAEWHAAEMREALARFVAAARRVSKGGKPGGKPGRTPGGGGDPERAAAIRQWAREQGMEVSERGRLPKPVVEAYDAAH